MLVWRLTRKAHAELTGEGARRFGGRWNHVGTSLVYTSGTLSLAVLEYLVHLPISDLPGDLVSIKIKIPDNVKCAEIDIDDLPATWRAFPAIEELKDLGRDWLHAGKTAILTVPSVVIPNESNYLLNPAHPETKHFTMESVDPFSLDPRLYLKAARKGTRKTKR